jgi:MFS superfamily sulfate permease-like transporter
MAGFITGLGIEVFTNQVRKVLAAPHVSDATSGVLAAAEQLKETLATSVKTEGYFVEVIALVQSIPRANLYSVAIGVGAFLIVRLMKRYAPRIPGALVALVLLTALVALLDLPAKGVGVLGNAVPSGLPALTVPMIPLADYLRLLPGALAIVAILLCEGLLVVRSYSNKYGYKADGDQMLFAYGAANLAAAFTGSIVTGNSPSRSAAMDASGARSQLPSLVAAGTIAVVMLFFTDLLAFLPTAALAGIVANAVLSLIEVHELRELWRMRRSEFWIAAVCLLSVLALGPLRAVLIAFLLSTIDIVRRVSRPHTAVLQEAPDGSHFFPVAAGQAPGPSGLVVYRFGAPLYFANAPLFLEEVEEAAGRATGPVRWFVLDAEAMVDVDTTGSEALRQAIAMLTGRGITFAISRAHPSFLAWLERYELLALIDPGRFYPTNRHAATAFRQERTTA